jgi:hypothetical protein
MTTVTPITLNEALAMLVKGGLMRIEPVFNPETGKVVDAYVPTEEGRRRWFGPLPPTEPQPREWWEIDKQEKRE